MHSSGIVQTLRSSVGLQSRLFRWATDCRCGGTQADKRLKHTQNQVSIDMQVSPPPQKHTHEGANEKKICLLVIVTLNTIKNDHKRKNK